jgi:hypothetical protein
MRNRMQLVLAVGVGLSSGAALGQSAPGAAGSNQVIPEKERALPSAEPKGGVPLTSGRSESLSDKLDASDGVIKPTPGVDPGIVQPAPVPHPNSTPVIRPPGTPGGAPGPEAK